MEPLFFKAENKHATFKPTCVKGASMEPLFFKAENTLQARRNGFAGVPASMEPLFFKAENMYCRLDSAPVESCFNGAAFFQSGKPGHRPHGHPAGRALQWSRFFSKRKMEQNSVTVRCPKTASMEPLFFKAENRPATQVLNFFLTASMEPLFFQSGKSGRTNLPSRSS